MSTKSVQPSNTLSQWFKFTGVELTAADFLFHGLFVKRWSAFDELYPMNLFVEYSG